MLRALHALSLCTPEIRQEADGAIILMLQMDKSRLSEVKNSPKAIELVSGGTWSQTVPSGSPSWMQRHETGVLKKVRSVAQGE